jgi:hypothetical protein
MMPYYNEPVDQNGGRSTDEKDGVAWGRPEFLVNFHLGQIHFNLFDF